MRPNTDPCGETNKSSNVHSVHRTGSFPAQKVAGSIPGLRLCSPVLLMAPQNKRKSPKRQFYFFLFVCSSVGRSSSEWPRRSHLQLSCVGRGGGGRQRGAAAAQGGCVLASTACLTAVSDERKVCAGVCSHLSAEEASQQLHLRCGVGLRS